MKVERRCRETVGAVAPRYEAGRGDVTELENHQDDAVRRRGVPTQLARRALADAREKTIVKEG